MMRCLELAAKGSGRVAPNPMVGAVLVHDGRIVGSGFHQKYGEAHAEVNAIDNCSVDPSKCTLYVNLEPCSHHGKTPPCAELIIRKGIRHVVIGQEDPNPLVAGRGIAMLREAGIEVQCGVAGEQAEWLNRRFNTYHRLGRPYVLLKWAQSADGYMDLDREEGGPRRPNWISHPASKKLVHKWRAEEGAVLVGAATLLHDDPKLTVRAYGHRPIHRVILSQRGKLPAAARMLGQTDAITVLSNSPLPAPGWQDKQRVNWVSLLEGGEGTSFLAAALKALHDLGLSSLLVEGGARTLQAFIAEGLWDEARILQSNQSFSSGLKAPELHMRESRRYRYGSDLISTYFKP